MNKKSAFSKLGVIDFKKLTPDDHHFLFEIEKTVENSHINRIRKRQEKLILNSDPLGYLKYTNKIPVTCEACLNPDKGIVYIRNSDKCQLDCKFCYYVGDTPIPIPKGVVNIFDIWVEPRDVALILTNKLQKVIRWVSYEPLMRLDNMFDLMKLARDAGFFQSLNTNGLLATERLQKQLKDSGLDDIRFNLAATLCDERVIKHLKIARGIFSHVGVESPMFHQFHQSFLLNKKDILDSIDYMTLQELQLTPPTMGRLYGPYYRYHGGHVNTLSSRNLIYDMFDMAEEEDWGISLFDCSSECKWYRGVMRAENNNYSGQWQSRVQMLPKDWFEWAIKTYY